MVLLRSLQTCCISPHYTSKVDVLLLYQQPTPTMTYTTLQNTMNELNGGLHNLLTCCYLRAIVKL